MESKDIILRTETEKDYSDVMKVVKLAFESVPYSDQSEHELVQRLRGSQRFVPDLSIVAEYQDEIIGHILLTEIDIICDEEIMHTGLALAPVSVHPQYQCLGIGSQLIRTAHTNAQALGYSVIILVGHEGYYPRFGYGRLDQYDITLPFDVPPANAMILILDQTDMRKVKGEVRYAPEFF